MLRQTQIAIKNPLNIEIKVPDMEWKTTGRNVRPQTKTLNYSVKVPCALNEQEFHKPKSNGNFKNCVQANGRSIWFFHRKLTFVL